MEFKCVVIALAFTACLCMTALAQSPEIDYIEPQFPGEDMPGSQIHQEVREGIYDDRNDSALSFQNESLFIIRKDTGMSPQALGKGVRIPVTVVKGLTAAPAAGSWAFALNDVHKSYLKLDLYQAGDAVFGSGELTDNGSVTAVTAGGSVLGDRLALFVVPKDSQNMYRFSLTIKPGSMDGEFIFTAPGITQPGVAYGSLLAPQVAQTLPVTAPTTT